MKPQILIGLIAVLLIPIAILLFYKGEDKKSTTTPTPTTNAVPPMTPTPTPGAIPSTPADAVTATQVKLKTDKGDIILNLYPDETPLAVTNFVTLGKRGYYDGVIFHRVIKGFMNQAGDPTGTGTGGESIYGEKFTTELTSRGFVKGVLGVARTSAMNTNGSQFFIMAADTHSLDNQYTAMGAVADAASQAVVDAINSVEVDAGDKPTTDVKITGFEIIK